MEKFEPSGLSEKAPTARVERKSSLSVKELLNLNPFFLIQPIRSNNSMRVRVNGQSNITFVV